MNGQTSSVSLDLRLEPMRMKEVNQKSYPNGGDKLMIYRAKIRKTSPYTNPRI